VGDITLTVKQRSALGFLSYKYGNGGSLHSADNHKFLQLHMRGSHDSAKTLLHRITPDCLDAFNRIMANDYRELSKKQISILTAEEKGFI
jgi:hypothetical protein